MLLDYRMMPLEFFPISEFSPFPAVLLQTFSTSTNILFVMMLVGKRLPDI